MNEMRYYEVKAKCGHVKKSKYTVKSFYVSAPSGKEAAERGRWLPRVKHHDKFAIIEVNEITKDECLLGKKTNDMDPYFKCHSKQEQNLKCKDLPLQIYEEDKPVPRKKRKNTKRNLLDRQQRKEWQKKGRGKNYE